LSFVIKPVNTVNYNQTLGAYGTWGKFCFHTDTAGGVYVGTSVNSRIEPADGPGPNTVVPNTWQNFTYTFDNGTAKFYKNGNLLATKTLVLGESWTSFVMGAAAATNALNGDIAEVLLYNTAISDADRKQIESYFERKYLIPKQNLQQWYKTDASCVTKNASNYVSEWKDQSGHGCDAIQPDSTQRPLWVDNSVNGYPVLRFDGGNDNLVSGGLPSIRETFSLLFVIRPSNSINYNQTLAAYGTWGKFCFHTDSTGGVYVGTSINSRIEPGDGPGANTIVPNAWQTFGYTFDNGTAKFYKNGTLLATKTLSLGESWTSFVLGSTSAVNTINGDIAEVLLYNTAISDTNRQQVEAYFKAKYID
jgi:hypothetical protein